MTALYWSVRTDGLVTYSAVADSDIVLQRQTQQVISLQEAIKTSLMQARGIEMIDLYHDRTCKYGEHAYRSAVNRVQYHHTTTNRKII